jgi:hypothetical protein
MAASPAFFLANVLLEGGLVALAAVELVRLRRRRKGPSQRTSDQGTSEETPGHAEGQKRPYEGGAEPP